jgi:hypothetical protein
MEKIRHKKINGNKIIYLFYLFWWFLNIVTKVAIILVKIYPKSGYKKPDIKYKSLIILLYFWQHAKSKYRKLAIFNYSFLTFGNWKPPKSFHFLKFFLGFKFVFWQNFANKNKG